MKLYVIKKFVKEHADFPDIGDIEASIFNMVSDDCKICYNESFSGYELFAMLVKLNFSSKTQVEYNGITTYEECFVSLLETV